MNEPKRDDPKDDRDSGVNDRPGVRTREREELEARFRRMGDLIPFGFWSADTQGAMQYVGDSLLEMTGAAPEEMRGDGWTKFLHGADRERTLASFRRAVAAESFWDHEHRCAARMASTTPSSVVAFRYATRRETSFPGPASTSTSPSASGSSRS